MLYQTSWLDGTHASKRQGSDLITVSYKYVFRYDFSIQNDPKFNNPRGKESVDHFRGSAEIVAEESTILQITREICDSDVSGHAGQNRSGF